MLIVSSMYLWAFNSVRGYFVRKLNIYFCAQWPENIPGTMEIFYCIPKEKWLIVDETRFVTATTCYRAESDHFTVVFQYEVLVRVSIFLQKVLQGHITGKYICIYRSNSESEQKRSFTVVTNLFLLHYNDSPHKTKDIQDYLSHSMRKCVFGNMRTAKTLIRLRGCAVWSGPRCPQTESLDTMKCFNWEQMPEWDFAHVQGDVNPHISRML